ncbi:hypothetical protein ACTL6P_03180 [Endozoicomonas acroporae]|uniref:hypothetical protein n=1 Tax=Endozoicomonas acroporae TaxID=1701104 RepID=UPI000C766258|nr:hypothetical protein [Endozoicomonas acroporae]
MKTIKALALVAAVSGGVFGAVTAVAATDGELSATSSEGSFKITLFNATEIQVYGLEDLTLIANQVSGTENPDPNQKTTTPVCVYTNAANYNMTIESSNGTGTNNLTLGNDGGGNPILYSVALQKASDSSDIFKWGAGSNNNGTTTGSLPKTTDPKVSSGTCVNQLAVALDGTPNNTEGTFEDTVTVTVAPI